jgi:hypothetical protein
MIIIYILFGAVLFIGGVFLGQSTSKIKKSDKFLRRGIINYSFEISQLNVKNGTVETQFEVGEIERTSTKSKIKVIDAKSSKNEFNSGFEKEKIIRMIDNSWIESNSIEWIESALEDIRDKKINEILK